MFYNGKKCLTFEEAMERSERKIKENAKKFAKLVIEMQRKDTKLNKEQYACH